MTSPTLLSLADRVSNLTTACRETDLAIGEAVGAADHSGPAHHRPFKDFAKHYTASLDAAMTLLVAGWEWEITNLYGHAQVNLPLNSSERGWQSVSRKDDNVVLAFVECALRARSALEASHG